MKKPFSTGALLKETTWTYLSSIWGAFQAFHMKITASGLWWRVLLMPSLPAEWVIQGFITPTDLPSHQHPPSPMVCGCVTTGLLDSLLFHWDAVSQKPHSSPSTACATACGLKDWEPVLGDGTISQQELDCVEGVFQATSYLSIPERQYER